MLSDEERSRFDRQIILEEFGEASQIKLKNASVLVVGAGGLGCPALQYLGAAGVGRIGIIDGDKVSLSNLHRQVLFNDSDIGTSKAFAAAQRIQKLNPFITIEIYECNLDPDNAIEVLEGYDLVVDCSDNFGTRYLVNDSCVILGIPFIYAAIHKFEGQLGVFNYNDGPTYRCLFPTFPDENLIPNCNEVGVIGTLPGVMGTYQAMEAIKVITGLGEVLSGKLLIIDLLNSRHTYLKIRTNPAQKNIKALQNYEFYCGTPIDEIEISELDAYLKTHQAELIDVREEHEFQANNIGGRNIPLSVFDDHIQHLNTGKAYVLICASGTRSLQALRTLDKHHFKQIVQVQGGINSLNFAGN